MARPARVGRPELGVDQAVQQVRLPPVVPRVRPHRTPAAATGSGRSGCPGARRRAGAGAGGGSACSAMPARSAQSISAAAMAVSLPDHRCARRDTRVRSAPAAPGTAAGAGCPRSCGVELVVLQRPGVGVRDEHRAHPDLAGRPDVRRRRVADHPGARRVQAVLGGSAPGRSAPASRPRCARCGSACARPEASILRCCSSGWPLVSSSRSWRVPSSASVSATPGISSTSWLTSAAASSVIALGLGGGGRALVEPLEAVVQAAQEAGGAVAVHADVGPLDVVEHRAQGRPVEGGVGQPVQVVRDHPLEQDVVLPQGVVGVEHQRLPHADEPKTRCPRRRECQVSRVACRPWTHRNASSTRSTSTTPGCGRPSAAAAGRCRRCSADEEGPPFVYTVGLSGFGHAELVLFATAQATAAAVLNDLGELVRAGRVLAAGDDDRRCATAGCTCCRSRSRRTGCSRPTSCTSPPDGPPVPALLVIPEDELAPEPGERPVPARAASLSRDRPRAGIGRRVTRRRPGRRAGGSTRASPPRPPPRR